MGTCNFHNKNASRIFASECEEEFDYEDLVSNIQCELGAKFGNDFIIEDEYEDGLRSFPGKIIGEIQFDSKYYELPELEIIPKVQVIIRSGYYAGVNLDWEMKIETNQYDEFDNIEDIEVINGSTGKEYPRHTEWAKNWCNKIIPKAIEKIEKTFEEFTTPLNCIGVFSNGEAIYEKA